ncbi:MAG TPA: tetratricopeptide repeat protein [Verrucomicrobiae bacterium]|nr:tetratricopeptide repeat protein [Verrucomicrobiae bacterium]
MPSENRTDPRKNFVPRFLPWLLAAAMLAVYCFTLNHWVSLFNIGAVAKISGLAWQPEITNPISFLATYPFRWLPSAEIPVALNIFSAVCAALTLGLLARSVAILPHNRTDVQRKRERSDFSFLTIRSAWLPPVLAVAACGLQLTFWENATNETGGMLDLLLFAFVIWSLLEYRLDEREWRLFLAAAVYGAGMAEDWAMVGFFPVFIAALVGTRKLNFFNLNFLGRMTLCGLAGMLFYLLLPLLAVVSHKMPVTFWQALKVNLVPQYDVLKFSFTALFHLFQPEYLQLVALLMVYLAPVLALAIRWKSSFGDRSYIGSMLATFMFHLIHAMLLAVCIWLMFDPPFGPRAKGFGLTFYYLLALSAGYYAGYFLLVFRAEHVSRSRRPKQSPFQFLNLPATGGVFLVSILAVAGLIYKNAPIIRDSNGGTFQKYTALVDENLPRNGGILLCDDPRRLFLTQASLARQGRAKDFVPLETASLKYPAYHKFLHAKFPQQWPDTVTAAEQTNGVGPLHLINLLAALAKTNELYYLHPSFGYYFERFYLEPHGLIYKLKMLPNDTFLPPPLDKNQIAENEDFWSRAEKEDFVPIERAIEPSAPKIPRTIAEKLFKRLHIEGEPALNAVAAGDFYSRSLDYWAVELQRAGDLTNAAAHFETAQKLNPDNVAAQINLQFNQKLRAGQTVQVDLSGVTPDRFGKSRTWDEVLSQNGPFDEPSFCFEEGSVFTSQKLFRQAAALFDRVRELAPDYLPARMRLAEIYLIARQPDRAFAALREPLEQPEKFSVSENDGIQLHLLAAAVDFQKNDTARGTELIEAEISSHPTNDDLLVTAAQAYMARGLFPSALAVINRKLKSAPDDPAWLFNKGYVFIQLKNYDDAIAALTRVLSIQTNNPQALFNRAIANLDSGKLDAAHADYETLRQTFTNSFQIAYGLGEIAWRKHETNEAIQNYELYLASAKTNTAEATNIVERLKLLKR